MLWNVANESKSSYGQVPLQLTSRPNSSSKRQRALVCSSWIEDKTGRCQEGPDDSHPRNSKASRESPKRGKICVQFKAPV